MSSQYGKLRPTDGWDRFGSLGHPIKLQWVSHLAFVTAATSLTGGQPNFDDVCPSDGLVHYIFIFGGSCPLTEFCPPSKSCIRLYWQPYCTALQQRVSAILCGVIQGMELRNFCRGRHLYSAGWPSRWASAHIPVLCLVSSVLSQAIGWEEHLLNNLFYVEWDV